jgi:hypothetical protein
MAGILNTEKFSNETPVVKAFDRTFALDVSLVKEDLRNLYIQLKNSKLLSNIVYDGELFEFSELFIKDFFNNIYEIMESYANIGTHEALILLIKNILGSNTTVSFSDDVDYDIIIDIFSVGLTGGFILTTQNDDIITTQNQPMIYITNRLGFTEQQLLDLIGKFIPIGIKYKINFNAGV